MANSRVMVECVAELTRLPLSRVVGHMRSLREAESAPVAKKGRGATAPQMTPLDAATLLCAIFASPNIQESASTIADLKRMPATPQGRVRISRMDRLYRGYDPVEHFTLGLDRDHSVLDGLAAAIGFFANEENYLRNAEQRFGVVPRVYAKFMVRSPEYSASLSIGVRSRFSEEWIYGRGGELDAFRTGQCTEITLRKIAACLRD